MTPSASGFSLGGESHFFFEPPLWLMTLPLPLWLGLPLAMAVFIAAVTAAMNALK